jgi:hypothetical protein
MPHFALRVALRRVLLLGVVALAVVAIGATNAGATNAGATTVRSAVEPPSGLVLRIDNGAAMIGSGSTITYRARVTNRERQDLANLKVTIDVSGPFVITEADGSRAKRSTIAQWQVTVPAGRTSEFAVKGRFRSIPTATKAVTATGCVFVAGRVGPLMCDSTVSGVARASESVKTWSAVTVLWVVLSAALSVAVVLILLLAAFRRRRRDMADDTDS